MKKHKKIIGLIVIGAFCILFVIIVCHSIVVVNASGKTYDNVEAIPHNKVGLLLATSPITPEGAHNYNFDNRIKAADELYKAGKVDFIIASGGDYTKTQKNGCDEPQAIHDSLVARGIPTQRIILDYDGTRTLSSIVKAKEVYGVDSLTLISQKYHNERAIYLAAKFGLYAIGYNANPSQIRHNRIKNKLREYLARVKMFDDILTGSYPKKDYFSHIYNPYDSVYIKYNHSKHINCFVTKYRVQLKDIYRLHWYYICCGDTVYSYEYDDVAKVENLQQICDSLQKMVVKNYPPEEYCHPYHGIHHDRIINGLGNYLTVESYEYSKDCSYGLAPHGDGVYQIYSYDTLGHGIIPSEIIDYKKAALIKSLLIDKFIYEKNRGHNEDNDIYYNKLRQQLDDAKIDIDKFAIGNNGLLYSFDYNDGDVFPISYADQFLIEIPYSSIQEVLTAKFKRTLYNL